MFSALGPAQMQTGKSREQTQQIDVYDWSRLHTALGVAQVKAAAAKCQSRLDIEPSLHVLVVTLSLGPAAAEEMIVVKGDVQAGVLVIAT